MNLLTHNKPTPIPKWAFDNVVEASGVMCPECGELETRSWYSASRGDICSWLLSVHKPCKSAWLEYGR